MEDIKYPNGTDFREGVCPPSDNTIKISTTHVFLGRYSNGIDSNK